jgi:hypothetical protein
MRTTEPINVPDAITSQDTAAELDYAIDSDGVCPNIGPIGRRARLQIAADIRLFIGVSVTVASCYAISNSKLRSPSSDNCTGAKW